MHPRKDYRPWFVSYMAFMSSLGALIWGYTFTVSNSLQSMLTTYVFPGASDIEFVFIASMPIFGAAIGSFFSGNLADVFGRRKIIIASDLLIIIDGILSVVQNLPVFIVGRTIVGLASGMNSVLIPIYNVEIAPVQIKGTVTSIYKTFVSFGQLIGLAVGYLVADVQHGETSQFWRFLFGLPSVLSLIRMINFFLIIRYDTPLYSALKGKLFLMESALKQIYSYITMFKKF